MFRSKTELKSSDGTFHILAPNRLGTCCNYHPNCFCVPKTNIHWILGTVNLKSVGTSMVYNWCWIPAWLTSLVLFYFNSEQFHTPHLYITFLSLPSNLERYQFQNFDVFCEKFKMESGNSEHRSSETREFINLYFT